MGPKVAKYWKNRQALSLLDGTGAEVTSIAVVGSDVYVTGSGPSGNVYGSVAKYWKNGQPIALKDVTSIAHANSIGVMKR